MHVLVSGLEFRLYGGFAAGGSYLNLHWIDCLATIACYAAHSKGWKTAGIQENDMTTRPFSVSHDVFGQAAKKYPMARDVESPRQSPFNSTQFAAISQPQNR